MKTFAVLHSDNFIILKELGLDDCSYDAAVFKKVRSCI
jgi:hypothetical protein